MLEAIKRFFGSLIASRETEAQRRVQHFAKHAVDLVDLDRKLREAGMGGL